MHLKIRRPDHLSHLVTEHHFPAPICSHSGRVARAPGNTAVRQCHVSTVTYEMDNLAMREQPPYLVDLCDIPRGFHTPAHLPASAGILLEYRSKYSNSRYSPGCLSLHLNKTLCGRLTPPSRSKRV